MGKILVIGTGGTISCIQREDGYEPFYKVNQLLDFIDIDKEDVDGCDLLSVDSSNVDQDIWRCMAECVHNHRDAYSGFVICHGTDTMAYSSSALTYMLEGIGVPVVFTGSQLPIDQEGTDAKRNLEQAIMTARELSGGVYVCFDGMVIQGDKASKMHSTDFRAFDSVNAPLVAEFIEGRLFEGTRNNREHFTYNPFFEMEPDVVALKMYPGMQASIFQYICESPIKGVVMECFGVGGFPNHNSEILEGFQKLAQKEIPVVVVTQCIYGGVELDVYEVSAQVAKSNVISGGHMTVEAALTKLMLTLKKCSDLEELKQCFSINLGYKE